MAGAYDPAFDALVMAAPIVDMIGDGRMEYDGPRCERCEDTPVDDTNVPCADCLTEIGDDHWACPRCPAHWYRSTQSHQAWAARLPVVQVAHLARHDREDGAERCPSCQGAGGWQQHDGLIVECPRGCMTRDDDSCTECGRDVSRPGLCFDCDVQGSYVGGLAPRFGAQP